MDLKNNGENFFTQGLNIVRCEFEPDLFNHYVLGQEDIDNNEFPVDTNWIQLMVNEIAIPNAKCYVADGSLVFYNLKTQEHVLVSEHTLVKRAEDVEFMEIPNANKLLSL